MYYKDSSYARKTLLDILIDNSIDQWEEIVDNYITDKKIQIDVSVNDCHVFDNTVRIECNSIKDVVYKNKRLKDSNLVFTRLKNGDLAVFYVFGQANFKINDVNYCNYLCLNVPVFSGSSFVSTSLYGFLDLKEFKHNLEQPKIFILSENRIIENKLKSFTFDNYISFVTEKLIVRQYGRRRKDCSYNTLFNLFYLCFLEQRIISYILYISCFHRWAI